MSVAILNGSTVTDFVEDGEVFNSCIEERFSKLDVDGDGVLSLAELKKGLGGLGLLETEFTTGCQEQEICNLYESVFEKFDYDRSGTVDLEEFRSEMKEILLAIACGVGDTPVQVVLENGSFLKKAVEFEMSKTG